MIATPTSNIAKATVMTTVAASIRMAIWSPRQQGSWCSGNGSDLPATCNGNSNSTIFITWLTSRALPEVAVASVLNFDIQQQQEK